MRAKWVLLVEDNPDDEELTLRAFKRSQFDCEVVVARDGLEAMELLLPEGQGAPNRPRNPPQLILLDLNLPRMDGLSLLRRLRADERTRLLPVIILTSSTEAVDLVESYSLGANSYVRKPVDFNEFLEAVRQLGLYWLLLNQAIPE